jgi:hypothetical protein
VPKRVRATGGGGIPLVLFLLGKRSSSEGPNTDPEVAADTVGSKKFGGCELSTTKPVAFSGFGTPSTSTCFSATTFLVLNIFLGVLKSKLMGGDGSF